MKRYQHIWTVLFLSAPIFKGMLLVTCLVVTGCGLALPPVRLITDKPLKVDVDMHVVVETKNTGVQAVPVVATSPITEEAVRRHRITEVITLMARGVVGVNRVGLLEMRPLSPHDTDEEYIRRIMGAENQDRDRLLMRQVDKTGRALELIRVEFSQRVRETAPAGTWIERQNDNGVWVWVKK
ncbi:MAG: DUF1318 domain-containing protein [Verrucomicrobiota bacterium]|nr:DUF1318 domain-containing protein [Verrucomicrobiota bacterium]